MTGVFLQPSKFILQSLYEFFIINNIICNICDYKFISLLFGYDFEIWLSNVILDKRWLVIQKFLLHGTMSLYTLIKLIN